MFDKTVEESCFFNGLRVILYGKSGIGKTHSISTIPNQDGVGILSTERGLRTLKKLVPKTKVQEINNTDDLREAHKWMKDNYSKFHTLVFDSFTEIAEFSLLEQKKRSSDPRKIYPEMLNNVFDISKSFKELPLNLIFICHISRGQDDSGVPFFEPDFPGTKLGSKAAHWNDAIFPLRVKKDENGETKRAFQTGVTIEDYLAKFRGNELNTFESADWSVIYEKLNINV